MRALRGLTQQTLAVKADLAVRTLSRIEAGEDCTVGTLTRIAAALDVTLSELVGEVEPSEAVL